MRLSIRVRVWFGGHGTGKATASPRGPSRERAFRQRDAESRLHNCWGLRAISGVPQGIDSSIAAGRGWDPRSYLVW
jgi:hypothetical protein